MSESVELACGPVQLLIRSVLCRAQAVNGVSPLAGMEVSHDGGDPVAVGVTAELLDPAGAPLGEPWRVELPEVGPGARAELPGMRLAWPMPVEWPAGPVTVRVTVTAGETSAQASSVLEFLGPSDWSGQTAPELLAAHLSPGGAEFDALAAEVGALLAERTGSGALDGYEAGPQRLSDIAEAVWDVLCGKDFSVASAGRRVDPAQFLTERAGTRLELACTLAAALARVGLRPVVALAGDAFLAGYLTDEVQLPDVVVTDPAVMVTLADSGVLDMVDPLCLLPGQDRAPLSGARWVARRWWAESRDRLELLLDVAAALRMVRPLDGSEPGTWSAGRELATPAAAAIAPSAVPARIDRWRRALLDMTYRNPLLRLPEAGSVGVHVPAGTLGDLEDLLAAGTGLMLQAHDDLARIHLEQGARTAADIHPDQLRDQLLTGHRLFVALPVEACRRRLTLLARATRRAAEETGTASLYLTLGTLHWTELGGRTGRAPLFLLPVKLTGKRGSVHFTLDVDERRDLQVNHCLIEKLSATWGLVIPELVTPTADHSGIDLPGAIAAVRAAVLGLRTGSFVVEETAHLATIGFSTLEQWRDLTEHWPQFLQAPAVRHLVHSPGSPFSDDIAEPAEDVTAEATSYLPIPADGSQLQAVRWAAAGKTFILEGPPGTGKSQTITNLIADCVARGRSVLFVAEKQAALDVVQRRLDAVGLGAFALDLHGRNQTVTAVREQLSAALDAAAPAAPGFEARRSAFRGQVEQLARYPRDLHGPGPMGMSAWQARQLVLDLAGPVATATPPVVDVAAAAVKGPHSLDDIYRTAADLEHALAGLGRPPAQSPWRIAGGGDPQLLDRPALTAALDALAAVAIGDPRVRALTDLARSEEDFTAVAVWCDTAADGTGRGTAEAAGLVTPDWLRRADELQRAVDDAQAGLRPQLGPFDPQILNFDVDGFVARSAEIDQRWFGKGRRRRALLAELSIALPAGGGPDPQRLTEALRAVQAVKVRTLPFFEQVHRMRGVVLPFGWSPVSADGPRQLRGVLHGVRAAARLRELLGSRADDLTAVPSGIAAGTGRLVWEAGQAWSRLLQLVNASPSTVEYGLGATDRGPAVAEWLPQWRADAAGGAYVGLGRWLRLRAALDRLEAMGLTELVRAVLDGERPAPDLELQVRFVVAQAVLAERLAGTGLAGFDDAERAHAVDRFLTGGDDLRERLAAQLPRLIADRRGFDPLARVGEIAELRRQLGRRRGGLTIRQLLHRFGPLIRQVTPCLLASPASVARFLPPDLGVDVVVFDEASQIRVPEAIGAMGRGKAVVVVGDTEQMPPTAMFATGVEEETEYDGDLAELPVPVDLESILSEAGEAGLPRLWLTWHYRSRDESLIAFSNRHYYGGRLSSFPAPPAGQRPRAVTLRRVDGQWEGGARGARVNRAEAAAVVAEILVLLQESPAPSIGVVTFNSQQRDLVLDLLETAAQTEPLLAAALDAPTEPLLVKNLENIQGDERDVILFTTAFAAPRPADGTGSGRAPRTDGMVSGRVPLNWGPLTRAGGQRRFNVAVTRARQAVTVFCSFDPRELDLSGSTSRGLAHLKDYLLAASGRSAEFAERRVVARDLHRDEVAAALRTAGLDVREEWGLSDFTVDLVVTAAGHEPIAVLLDGPGWAARRTVGDRDGLPATVLTGMMKWPAVHRIWLPTWLRDPAGVVAAVTGVASGTGLLSPEW